MLIAILGAGESGVGTAILAQKMGFEVFVSDANTIQEKYIAELQAHAIDYEQGKHDTQRILTAGEVVKSPGIPDSVAIIQAIKAKNIDIVSEIEFAARYTTAKLIGITGTNGKTTTTLLTYHLLCQGGYRVGLAGNVGQSFAKQVATENFEWFVLELSSFQLEGMFKARINIAVLTNITPDHLDRYNNEIGRYVAAKFRILQNQTLADYFIYNKDNILITNALKEIKTHSNPFPFSIQKPLAIGGFCVKDTMIIQKYIHTIGDQDSCVAMPQSCLTIKGNHNLQNALCAAMVATVVGLDAQTISTHLGTFVNASHRFEFVGERHGVQYINDSKSTTIDSTRAALESFEPKKNVVWIVGGQDKGNDYGLLLDLVRTCCRAIVCLGLDNSPILTYFKDKFEPIYSTSSLDGCMKLCGEIAQDGDVVLLSPACASFDLFKNYEDRGNKFKAFVEQI